MLVVSGDHSTPCIKKAHTDDPIPILFTGAGVEKTRARGLQKENLCEGAEDR